MYTREEIKKELYRKYIEPTKHKEPGKIGVEIEMPIAKLDGSATDYEEVQKVFALAIRKYGLKPEKYDDNRVCYLASDAKTGDSLSFDCSYNNIEISMGCETGIDPIKERFESYVYYLNSELEKTGHLLTGMGVNPNYAACRKDFIPGSRYRMLERFLKKSDEWSDPMYFHPYADFGSYASAFQIQLDVEERNLIDTIRAFSLLEPVKAVLFDNSILESEPDLLCCRDMFWENSTHGINPHNIGAFEATPESIDDLLEYIATTSIFCTERDGRYYHFHPVPIVDYYKQDSVTAEYYENGEFHTTRLVPELGDLAYLRTYKFVDLTFRGTIEFRSVCCQPLSEIMSAAAFHVGLINAVPELLRLLESDRVLYHHGYSHVELRKLMNQVDLPDFVNRDGLKELCISVLDLAKEGLKRSGAGSCSYLDPLYKRARELMSPGREYVLELRQGTPKNELIRQYSLHKKESYTLPADNEKVRSLLLTGAIGLEKEALRVTGDGRLAKTPDPFAGDKNIVKDFAENQTEINTGISPNAEGAIAELAMHTSRMNRVLLSLPEKEYLWPFSNPPFIENEEDIPVAVYSGDAKHKSEYRNYLADRYGRYKMAMSGIHVNYSFSDELLYAAYELSDAPDFRSYKDRFYLRLAKRSAIYGWIVTALTAASPIMDHSYFERGHRGEDIFTGMASVRCSELGYWNHFAVVFDYSDIDKYADSLQDYVNNGLIAYASELYYPVRLKPKGTNTLETLKEGGVNHIEFRMIDLNPLSYPGIDIRDLKFIQLLLIYLASTPEEKVSLETQVQAVQNFKSAAHFDLDVAHIVAPDGSSASCSESAVRILSGMKDFYRDISPDAVKVLDFEMDKLTDPTNRYAWKIKQEYFGKFAGKALDLAKSNSKL